MEKLTLSTVGVLIFWKVKYSDNNRINKTIAEIIQLLHNIKQKETILKLKLGGNSRGKLHEGQGILSGLSPLRSVGYHDSQKGRLDRRSDGQMPGRLPGLSPLRSDGSQVVRLECWTA